jgi:hypothetical protein
LPAGQGSGAVICSLGQYEPDGQLFCVPPKQNDPGGHWVPQTLPIQGPAQLQENVPIPMILLQVAPLRHRLGEQLSMIVWQLVPV